MTVALSEASTTSSCALGALANGSAGGFDSTLEEDSRFVGTREGTRDDAATLGDGVGATEVARGETEDGRGETLLPPPCRSRLL